MPRLSKKDQVTIAVREYYDCYQAVLRNLDQMAEKMELILKLGGKIGQTFDTISEDGFSRHVEIVDLYNGKASRWHSVFAERIGVRRVKD